MPATILLETKQDGGDEFLSSFYKIFALAPSCYKDNLKQSLLGHHVYELGPVVENPVFRGQTIEGKIWFEAHCCPAVWGWENLLSKFIYVAGLHEKNMVINSVLLVWCYSFKMNDLQIDLMSKEDILDMEQYGCSHFTYDTSSQELVFYRPVKHKLLTELIKTVGVTYWEPGVGKTLIYDARFVKERLTDITLGDEIDYLEAIQFDWTNFLLNLAIMITYRPKEIPVLPSIRFRDEEGRELIVEKDTVSNSFSQDLYYLSTLRDDIGVKRLIHILEKVWALDRFTSQMREMIFDSIVDVEEDWERFRDLFISE